MISSVKRCISMGALVFLSMIIGLRVSPLFGQSTFDWPKVTETTKPWTRWWWMGNAVDPQNLGALLELYAETGLGGVEITPIYGVQGAEDRFIEFLSPDWMAMLDTTIKEAAKHGMRVDMNHGTGWPFGGPQITPRHAASLLIVQTYTLNAGQILDETLQVEDQRQRDLGVRLEALTAYGEDGRILDLTDRVDAQGRLDWSPSTGRWDLYAAFCGKTRQQVKRAAPGGAGYTMDHYSKEALAAYLARFDQAFEGFTSPVRCFFNDSYEVYKTSWSPVFLDEFQKRRGYDLRRYVRELVTEEKSETVARVKTDYRVTMSEILLENFTMSWTEWAHQRGSQTKNQAHGSPANLLDLYAAVDIPEGEIFGSTTFDIPGLRHDTDDTRNADPDPLFLKFASSGGHIAGKPLIACETFTWLGEHFKVALSQCKPDLERVFLAGVNHVFYHGTTYSPQQAQWPGWLFYASVNFAPTNSFWCHLQGLNHYITRCQSILQSGRPDNELLVYWPIYDVWNNPEGLDMPLTVHNVDQWLKFADVRNLLKRGYLCDFISDAWLSRTQVNNGQLKTSPAGSAYKVLIVPECRILPLATLETIIQLAREGATVIFHKMPSDVPGLKDLANRRARLSSLLASLSFNSVNDSLQQAKVGRGSILLCADPQKALTYARIQREALTDLGLEFIRRRTDQGTYYYLVNHTPKAIEASVPLNIKAQSVIILDPQTGKLGLAVSSIQTDQTQVEIQMQSGEALFLYALDTEIVNSPAAWSYCVPSGSPVEIKGPWHVEFQQGGPVRPQSRTLNTLVSWTDMGDPEALRFSGQATYTLAFNLSEDMAEEYRLDLGRICESARVRLNGRDAGIFWSIPFNARVGEYLKPGINKLEIEVANLMANRIRDLDKRGVTWRKFHEINFVNILYQPFDASTWEPMPSGLLGPVTLTPMNKAGGRTGPLLKN